MQPANSVNTYTSWCIQSKQQIQTTCRIHLLSRYNKIKTIIHQRPQLQHFTICEKEMNRILQDINSSIKTWKGVELQLCTKKKTTFKAYKRTATNWYNRNKAKIFGNYFFYPLIFKYLLNHCKEIQNIDENTKMNIFIQVFVNIFDETIRFKKTKCQPLLPYQTVIQPNKFKNECTKLMEYYGITLDLSNINPLKIGKKYQKDNKRSQKISNSFKNALLSIQQLLIAKKCSFYSMAGYANMDMPQYHYPNSNIAAKALCPQTQTQKHTDNNNNNNSSISFLNNIIQTNTNLNNNKPVNNNVHRQSNPITLMNYNSENNKALMIRYQVLEYKPVINEYILML